MLKHVESDPNHSDPCGTLTRMLMLFSSILVAVPEQVLPCIPNKGSIPAHQGAKNIITISGLMGKKCCDPLVTTMKSYYVW